MLYVHKMLILYLLHDRWDGHWGVWMCFLHTLISCLNFQYPDSLFKFVFAQAFIPIPSIILSLDISVFLPYYMYRLSLSICILFTKYSLLSVLSLSFFPVHSICPLSEKCLYIILIQLTIISQLASHCETSLTVQLHSGLPDILANCPIARTVILPIFHLLNSVFYLSLSGKM